MVPRIPRQLWARAHPRSISNLIVSLNIQQTRTIRSISKHVKASPYNKDLLPKAFDRMAALKRKEYTTPIRTGLLAEKKGMSAWFDEETGERMPCTVLQVDSCQVVGHKTFEPHGYWASVMGYGSKKWHTLNKAELGNFIVAQVPPKAEVMEFRVRDEKSLLPIGTMLEPSWFKVGQLVDCRSITKGKGFAGGMKRHGWSGQPASHGQSLTHRTMGSAGGGQGSGSRVIPGKKMPGNMGNEWNTIQHLKVLKVDDENGLVIVKGHVSGPKKSIIQIYDSKKRQKQVADLGLPLLPPSLVTPEAQINPDEETKN